LIREYDEAMITAEASHEKYTTTLSALDAVLPPKDYRPPATNPRPQSTPKRPSDSSDASTTSPKPTLYTERMNSIVNEALGPSAWRAAQYSRSLEATLRRIPTHSTTGAQTYPTITSAPASEPDWSYSMTPLYPSD
jgi:hypothetical protein